MQNELPFPLPLRKKQNKTKQQQQQEQQKPSVISPNKPREQSIVPEQPVSEEVYKAKVFLGRVTVMMVGLLALDQLRFSEEILDIVFCV